MKTTKRFAISFFTPMLIIGMLAGCNKYLDTDPEDFIAPTTYYKTEAQITTALMGIYDVLGERSDASTYSRGLVTDLIFATDQVYARSFSSSISPTIYYEGDASTPLFTNCWAALYEGINRANLLLENVDNADAPEAVKNTVKGEALFLRAYFHFLLVTYWGDVPLKTHSTASAENSFAARDPAAEIYHQVISDMTTAAELVKDIDAWGHNGRVSQTAVQGILARVCLYAAGRLNQPSFYAEAREWALKVINSGKHSLSPDYRQIFINHCEDKYDIRECIWEIEFFGNGAGSNIFEAERFAAWMGIKNSHEDLYNYGTFSTTGPFYNLYEAADLRRDWCISPYYYSGNNSLTRIYYPVTLSWGRFPAKWRREYEATLPLNKNFGSVNFPVLRYADVLLMFAEAENEVNGPTAAAYDAINQVRRRAFGTGSRVLSITLDDKGTGYSSAPTITLSPSNAANGANNGAMASATVSGGKLTAINIISGGAFYANPPQVTITGTGSGASATAVLAPVPDADLNAGLSKEDFSNAVRDERARELAFEGLRKADLLRWKTFIPVMKNMIDIINTTAPANSTYSFSGKATALLPYNSISDRDTLFPIPSLEMSVNKAITQNNPGW